MEHKLMTNAFPQTFAHKLAFFLSAGSLWLGCTGQGPEKVSLPKDAPELAVTANTVAMVAANATASTSATIPEVNETKSRVSGAIMASKQGQASFRVAGHIEKTLVNVGDRVRKGQVMASLNSSDYVLREKIARVQIEQAKISLEQAKKDMERENQLKREGATTQTNFEKVSNQLAASQLAHTQAQINHQQIEDQVSDTRLMASFDGVISKRLKVEGEWVAIGNAVFEVSALGELEVSFRMPEALLRKVKIGQIVKVSIPSIEKETDMNILRIVPVIQENSRTFEIIGRLEQSETRVFPGQFVEAQF